MNDCQSCSQFPDLHSYGQLLFYSKDPTINSILKSTEVVDFADSVIEEERIIAFTYSSFSQMDLLLFKIENLFSKEQKKNLLATYSSNESQGRFINMAPFQQFLVRLQHRDYLTIINQRKFTQFLQPIIKLQENEVYGYEFLLRQASPSYPFYPSELFSYSQSAGLQSNLDSQARFASIEVGSKLLNRGIKRFINFLPSSIYDPNHCLKSTFQAVEQFGVDPKDLVFEVVETEKIEDVNHLKKIFRTYQDHGMKLALDDLGAGYSTIDVLKALKPNFAKLDRNLIDHCDQDKDKQKGIQQIVEIGKEYGITLLAEGIERQEEAAFCKDLGIPLAQGYYFGRPNAKPLEADRRVS